MSLAFARAYCLSTCLTARDFSSDYRQTIIGASGGHPLRVLTGTCVECGNGMVRVHSDNALFPEQSGLTGTVSTNSSAYGYGEDECHDSTQARFRTVRVSELLNKITDSVDLSGTRADGHARWGSIVANKAGAGHFTATLRALLSHGQIMPVVAWNPYDNGTWTIGNGHHRLTALLLIGVEMVRVVESLSSDYMRAGDSSDDDASPIVADSDQWEWWSAVQNSLPTDGQADQQETCSACRYGCDCCRHEAWCENVAVTVPTGTNTRAAREARALVDEAQRAAGAAVYAMIQGRRQEQRALVEGAAAIRERIEQLIEEAAAQEQRADKIGGECEALWGLYSKAVNITAGY